MANLKRLEQLSRWLEYELETKLLDPPVIKVRLRPTDAFTLGQAKETWQSNTRMFLEIAIGAVAEWDLTEDGKPLAMGDGEAKAAVLRPLMSEKLKGKDSILGVQIVEDSSDRENFLKN